jgi:Domain of unknown function (DUF4190)
MKKCPTCERTFEDSMRFCQSDGTPLVDDAPPLDPYKTMVARPDEIAAGLSANLGASEPAVKADEEVLQLPVEADPLKTMYASEEEIRKEMEAHDSKDEPVMDIPPLAPEPPKFTEPSLSPPSFGDPAPPPSPFGQTTPPIPSPFDKPKPSTYEPPAPNFPEFKEPEPVISNVASDTFQPQSPAAPEWTPPPAIEPSYQQEPMQNPSFTPAPAAGGPSQTLAIVSLVVGILGLTVCCGSFVPSVVAIVLGFMAKGKASNDPANYGGSGLALGGIITGVLGLLLGVVIVALYFLGFLAGLMGNMR